jgi:hypothetical protein
MEVPNPDKPEPKTKAHPDAPGQSRQDNAKEKHLRVSLRFLCDLASLREFFYFFSKDFNCNRLSQIFRRAEN